MAIELSVYEDKVLKEVRKTPGEYLPNLLQLVRLSRESVSLKPAAASFKQGWQEAQSGQTRPVSELWEKEKGARLQKYSWKKIPKLDGGFGKSLPGLKKAHGYYIITASRVKK